MLYKPEPLVPRRLSFSEELYAYAFDVEANFMRLDEASVHFPYASSLRCSLVTLEMLSTASISGTVPDLRVVIWMLGREAYGKGMQEKPPACLAAGSDDELESARKAARYGRALAALLSSPMHRELRESDFLQTHAFLAHGSQDSDVRYRRKPLTPHMAGVWGTGERSGALAASKTGRASAGSYEPQHYRAPLPQEIPPLMRDLFSYVNATRQAPSLQAAVAHFQLQAIHPLSSTIDCTERLLSLTIMRNRGVIQHLIPTLGYPLAANYERCARLLVPYLLDDESRRLPLETALERWARCCLEDLEEATRVVQAYMKLLRKTIEKYYGLLGPCHEGTTIDVLVRELPGLPVMDAQLAVALTGKTFPAVAKAIDELVEKGILTQIGAGKRNRVYEARDILAIEQQIIDSSFGEARG